MVRKRPTSLELLAVTVLFCANITSPVEASFTTIRSVRFGVRACLEDRRQATARLALAMSSILNYSDGSSAKASHLSEQTSIRWGIVGVGDVVSIKSGPPFFLAENSKLVAVMRRTPGAAAAWADKNVPPEMNCRAYDDLQKFLADPFVDAVYIATPPGAHLEVAEQVAHAGKPCYVEKPVGRCAWETQAICKAFKDRDLPLFTAYVSRAFERTRSTLKLLSEGAVGNRVDRIQYTLRGSDLARGLDWGQGIPWRLNAEKSGGGLIMDVGCHVLDRIDYICGPIVNVTGSARISASSLKKQDVEDIVQLQGVIGPSTWAPIASDGAKVECTWNFSSPDSVDELVISGPHGSLVMAAMSPFLPIQVLGQKGELRRELTFDKPVFSALELIQEMTNELIGIEEAMAPSRGDNAVRTSAVLDAALSSYYGGRHDEFWRRKESWPRRKFSSTI